MIDRKSEPMILTAEQSQRFLAVFERLMSSIIGNPRLSDAAHYEISRDYYANLHPIDYLMWCLDESGAETFSISLLHVTLDIYHHACEWLPIFYGIALTQAEAYDMMGNYLVQGPNPDRDFIEKALAEIETMIQEQIACNFCCTPYEFELHEETCAHFKAFYDETLRGITTLRTWVSYRRLLL